jgi:hypothetical protein
MARPIDFRKFAEECARLAKEAQAIEDKSLLLGMAQAWIRLADQAQSVQALLDANSS